MSDPQVEYLASLLGRAIGSVVVTHDRSKQPIDILTYRKKLQRYGSRHWPYSDLNHPEHYTLTIENYDLRTTRTVTCYR